MFPKLEHRFWSKNCAFKVSAGEVRSVSNNRHCDKLWGWPASSITLTEMRHWAPPILGTFLLVVAVTCISVYGDCMARMISTTIRLNEEDVRALKRARAAGHSASELVRKGLRVVASRYYAGRRAPSTLLFESTDAKLGDESELFQDVED